MKDKIFEVASWGKYIYRSDIEYRNYEKSIENDEGGIRFFIYSSHWLASLYVVVEGWGSLKLKDARIEKLLLMYEDYVLTIKRCRNAVYHYQKDVLDKRVEAAVGDKELQVWAGALLDEFIRFLYLYPLSTYGICEESLSLQEEYFGLIGWVPERVNVVKWLENYICIIQYYKESNAELLERSSENDDRVGIIFQKLKSVEINPYTPMLSRITRNA